MHLELRKFLGDNVANSLMEHLPPLGWGEVAQKSDVNLVQLQLNLVEKQLNRLSSSFRVLIGVLLSASVAFVILLIQVNQSLSNL